MAITQGILDIVLDTAEKSQAKKVNSVNLIVGSLSQVVPDCVISYFEVMAKETIAEGAQLNIQMIEAKAKCTNCGTIFAAEDMSVKCPNCGDILGQMISGRELSVESIDID
ncbi:MAG: hydrogenase maturation nickel metallochaperone HypA [Actinomycetota bacterium]